MDKLASYDDINVPNKQMACRDNEILNPQFVRNYIRFYESRGFRITDEISLIKAFFKLSVQSPYAGFKSMPNRHRSLTTLINTTKLKIITLDRKDLASTVASFIIAMDRDTWRRDGGEQVYNFEFKGKYVERSQAHLRYVLPSIFMLKEIPGAIHLSYEDLCMEDFTDPALDSYFGRAIRLDDPKPPTNAEHYVTNWDSFKSYIDEQSELLKAQRKKASL